MYLFPTFPHPVVSINVSSGGSPSGSTKIPSNNSGPSAVFIWARFKLCVSKSKLFFTSNG